MSKKKIEETKTISEIIKEVLIRIDTETESFMKKYGGK